MLIAPELKLIESWLVMVAVAAGFHTVIYLIKMHGLPPPACSSLGRGDSGACLEKGGKLGSLLLRIVDSPLALIGVPLGIGGAGSGILRVGVGGRRVTGLITGVGTGTTAGSRRLGELDGTWRHELG